ncbi:MAG TPA: hypothetical protein ENH87_04480 [Pricia antarctica]|uniref:Uncharacterized protein n=1 Tax=Pricia antarctica TaxID=641691 RepID=A0A831QNE9_9FLAO|nr:hypothetical protein [Pricia antarctica]
MRYQYRQQRDAKKNYRTSFTKQHTNTTYKARENDNGENHYIPRGYASIYVGLVQRQTFYRRI